MSLPVILLWSSLLALVLTKLADLWTTLSHVGPAGESNPLFRRLCPPLTFRQALALVMLVWTGVVALAYVPAFHSPLVLHQIATSLVGFVAAAAQADAARFNATGNCSRFTRIVIRIYARLRPGRLNHRSCFARHPWSKGIPED